jgi:hypothetical protein
VRFRYCGHRQRDNTREFIFEDTAPTNSVDLVSVMVSTDQLSRCGVRLQDAPQFLLRLLAERIVQQASTAPAARHFTLSDADLTTGGIQAIGKLEKRKSRKVALHIGRLPA